MKVQRFAEKALCALLASVLCVSQGLSAFSASDQVQNGGHDALAEYLAAHPKDVNQSVDVAQADPAAVNNPQSVTQEEINNIKQEEMDNVIAEYTNAGVTDWTALFDSLAQQGKNAMIVKILNNSQYQDQAAVAYLQQHASETDLNNIQSWINQTVADPKMKDLRDKLTSLVDTRRAITNNDADAAMAQFTDGNNNVKVEDLAKRLELFGADRLAAAVAQKLVTTSGGKEDFSKAEKFINTFNDDLMLGRMKGQLGVQAGLTGRIDSRVGKLMDDTQKLIDRYKDNLAGLARELQAEGDIHAMLRVLQLLGAKDNMNLTGIVSKLIDNITDQEFLGKIKESINALGLDKSGDYKAQRFISILDNRREDLMASGSSIQRLINSCKNEQGQIDYAKLGQKLMNLDMAKVGLAVLKAFLPGNGTWEQFFNPLAPLLDNLQKGFMESMLRSIDEQYARSGWSASNWLAGAVIRNYMAANGL